MAAQKIQILESRFFAGTQNGRVQHQNSSLLFATDCPSEPKGELQTPHGVSRFRGSISARQPGRVLPAVDPRQLEAKPAQSGISYGSIIVPSDRCAGEPRSELCNRVPLGDFRYG